MSNAQHTPGPWERDDGYIVSLHNHEKIATVHDWTTEDEDIDRAKANARLIAAAPELLEALENRPVLLEEDTIESFRERYIAWQRRRDASISKARGRQ